MAKHIKKCAVCNAYTMQEIHCSKKTLNPKPQKYSPEDKYTEYRRKAKLDERKKQGIV